MRKRKGLLLLKKFDLRGWPLKLSGKLHHVYYALTSDVYIDPSSCRKAGEMSEMRKIQDGREKSALSVVFLDPSQIPDSPAEPEPYPADGESSPPKFIPLQDVQILLKCSKVWRIRNRFWKSILNLLRRYLNSSPYHHLGHHLIPQFFHLYFRILIC